MAETRPVRSLCILTSIGRHRGSLKSPSQDGYRRGLTRGSWKRRAGKDCSRVPLRLYFSPTYLMKGMRSNGNLSANDDQPEVSHGYIRAVHSQAPPSFFVFSSITTSYNFQLTHSVHTLSTPTPKPPQPIMKLSLSVVGGLLLGLALASPQPRC